MHKELSFQSAGGPGEVDPRLSFDKATYQTHPVDFL